MYVYLCKEISRFTRIADCVNFLSRLRASDECSLGEITIVAFTQEDQIIMCSPLFYLAREIESVDFRFATSLSYLPFDFVQLFLNNSMNILRLYHQFYHAILS